MSFKTSVILTTVIWGLIALAWLIVIAFFPETKTNPPVIFALAGVASIVSVVLFAFRRFWLLKFIIIGLLALPIILLQSYLDAKRRGDRTSADGYWVAMWIHIGIYALVATVYLAIRYSRGPQSDTASLLSLASKAS